MFRSAEQGDYRVDEGRAEQQLCEGLLGEPRARFAKGELERAAEQDRYCAYGAAVALKASLGFEPGSPSLVGEPGIIRE